LFSQKNGIINSYDMRDCISTIFCVLFCLFVSAVNAQDRYWVNGSGDWNDSSHWSEISGGSGGASIPALENNVYFDNSSSKNDYTVTMPEFAAVNSLTISSRNKINFASNSSQLFCYNTKISRKFRRSYDGEAFVNPAEESIRSTSRSSTRNTLNITNIKNVSCNGGNDGEITFTFTPSGGVTNFRYQYINLDDFSAQSIVTTATTYTFTNLTPGDIVIRVKDGDLPPSSASLSQALVTVTQPNPLSLTMGDLTITDVTCNGGTNGTISARASGATAPYEYTLTPGGVTNSTGDFTGLSQGVYQIVVDDANNCGTVTLPNINVGEPAPISIDNVIVTNANCFGVSNGKIRVEASGGNNLEFTVNGADYFDVGTEATGLAIGDYTVTVRDKADHACSLTDGPYTVSQPAEITYTVTLSDYNGNNIGCFGGNNGIITVNGTGGEANNIEYSIGGGYIDVGNSFNNLTKGDYTLTVRDKDNPTCTKTEVVTLTEPTEIVIAETVTNVTCNGGNNGSVAIAVTEGTGPYSVTLLNGAMGVVGTKAGANVVFNDLTADTYTISVTDLNGCNKQKPAVVTEPNAIAINETLTHVTCNGGNNGKVIVSVGGGTEEYTIELLQGAISIGIHNNVPSASAREFANLVAGNYTIKIVDKNSCEETKAVTINQPADITINAAVTDNGCFGESNGIIGVQVTGGTANYTVHLLDNGDNPISQQNGVGESVNIQFTGLAKGDYKIKVVDNNSCEKEQAITVSEPTEVVPTSAKTDISCNGGADGIITISANGGTGNFSFQLLNAALNPIATHNNITPGTDDVFNGLSAGDYTVKITDANGCEKTVSLTLTEPTAITVAETLTNLTCSGAGNGEIAVVVNGGTAPYKIELTGGTPQTENGVNAGVTTTFTGLDAIEYTITITDAKMCTHVVKYTLTEPTTHTIVTAETPAKCSGGNDGTVDVTVTGGTPPYSISLTGGAISKDEVNVAENVKITFTDLTAQEYDIVVTDKNGCVSNAKQVVTEPNIISLKNLTSNPVVCNGESNGSISASVIGGTANYTVTLLDNGGTQVAEILNKPEDDPFTFTGLAAGIYYIRVLDANTCLKTFTQAVIEPGDITAIQTIENVKCFGGSDGVLKLTISGGTPQFSLELTNSGGVAEAPIHNVNTGVEVSFTGLSADKYTLKITDANGCEKEIKDIDVTEPAEITTTITPKDVNCNGGNDGEIEFTVEGGVPTFIVELRDNGGNVVDRNLTVAQSTATKFTGLVADTYSIRVIDANMCIKNVTGIVISQPGAIVTDIKVQKHVECFGDLTGEIIANVTSGGVAPFTVSIDGGTNYNYPAGLINNLAAGDYSVIIKDANGCTTTAVDLTITEPTELKATFDVVDVLCKGDASGKITVNATGGTAPYEYKLDHLPYQSATNIYENLIADTYQITVRDANGCIFTEAVTIVEPTDGLSIDGVNFENITGCFGDATGRIEVLASGSSAITYYIDGAMNLTNGTGIFENLIAGSYTVRVVDAGGCVAVHPTPIEITQPTELEFEYVTVVHYPAGSCWYDNIGEIHIKAKGSTGTSPYQYSIDDGPFSNVRDFVGLTAGVHKVSIQDAKGCRLDQNVTINGPAPIVINSLTAKNPTCFGVNNGEIVANVTGGTGTLMYSLDGGTPQASGTFVGVSAGKHDLKIVDDNGCILEEKDIELVSPPAIIVSAEIVKYATGDATPDGEIKATVTGGTNAYIVSIERTDVVPSVVIPTTGKPTEFTFTGLVPGEYRVHTDDDNSCGDITIDITLTPFKLIITKTDITCFGNDNGVVNVEIVGGKSPYNINYKNDVVPATFDESHNGIAIKTDKVENLKPGNYIITVTDSEGNVTTGNATIVEPTEIGVTFVVKNVTCNGGNTGEIEATITGGTPNYDLVWSSTSLGADITNNGVINKDVISNLRAGDYNVRITDSNGCFITGSTTVSEPTKVVATGEVVTAISADAALDGAIKVTATGGSGKYLFKLEKVDEVPVQVINGPAAPNYKTEHLFENLGGVEYLAYATDENGCISDASVKIMLTKYFVRATPTPTCFGEISGKIDIEVIDGTAPFTISWNHVDDAPANITIPGRNHTFTNLRAGEYKFEVTDAGGLVFRTSAIVTENTEIVATETIVNTTCFELDNGSIELAVTGGTAAGLADYTFLWNTGATTNKIENLAAGDYTVTITDQIGCSISKTYTVTKPDAITATIIAEAQPTADAAADGKIRVLATGGTPPYTYKVYRNAVAAANLIKTETTMADFIIVDNLTIGDYIAVISDANGCAEATSNLFTLSRMTVELKVYPVTCLGENTGRIIATVNGGVSDFDFTWTKPTGDVIEHLDLTNPKDSIYDIPVGEYRLSIVDKNGQSPKVNPTIIRVENLAFNVPHTIVKPKCNFNDPTGRLEINEAGITSNYPNDTWVYRWLDDNTVPLLNPRANINSGRYSLEITNGLGCKDTTHFDIGAINEIKVNAGLDQTICKGSSVDIDYTASGLNSSATVSLYYFDTKVKSSEFKTITGGAISGSYVHTPEDKGEYRVYVVDEVSTCTMRDTMEVFFHPQMNLQLLKDSSSVLVPRDYVLVGSEYNTEFNNIVRLDESLDPIYAWEDSEKYNFIGGTSTTSKYPIIEFVNPKEGQYIFLRLNTTSKDGCKESAQFKIRFIESTPPNGISPNNDGIHDCWLIPNAEQYPDMEVMIVNRWGIKVFYTKHYNNDCGSDDNFRGLSSGGNKLAAGTYYFIINYNRDGIKPVKGSITVVR